MKNHDQHGRQKKKYPNNVDGAADVDSYDIPISISDPMKMTREYDQQTTLDEDKTKHTIPVCILHDRFIMGVEKIMYIDKMTLQQHVSSLGVDIFRVTIVPLCL